MKKFICYSILLFCSAALAWEPSKQIEGLIAWTPGSVNDVTFRALAIEVEKNTGAKFVVVNRSGASGVVGTEELSKRPADGYSVTVVSVPGIAAMDRISVPGSGRTYTTDSFVYPLHVASSPFAIVTNPKDTVTNAKDFAKVLKTEKVTVAASGGARIIYESIKEKLKFTQGVTGVVRVDHKGPNDALMDVVSGNIRFAIVPVSVANPLYRDGKVNIIALSGPPPLHQLSDISLISDAIPGFDISGMWALMLPARTPDDVVQWYTREFSRALQSDSVKALYHDNLLLVRTDLHSPTTMKNYVKSSERQWKSLVDNVLDGINNK
jgi:tripartite-type tricarboxylate transporter receptor subunit TctC